MLIPKKVKHRKWQKGRSRRKGLKATRYLSVDFGDYGLKATTTGWVTSREIEAARRAMVRYTRKGGKIWIRIFPDKPVTTKGTHSSMGKGKGAPEYFVAVVRPGTVLFEISGIDESHAREALKQASYKLRVKTKVVTK